MKSNKKSTANFINILLTSKSLTNTNLSNINVTYKETNNNNRSPNLEAYINNCVSLSSYDINDNLIDSSNGILGYYNNALCLTIGDINLSNILTNLGINYNQINSIILELEGSFSPYYGYIEIYDNNGDYFDTIDCTDGHNPLEIDIKAIYDESSNASFALIPVEPCSGITLFDSANAYLRINYQSDVSYLSIEQAPNKVSYFEGEAFDPTGMVIKLFHNDGSSEVITNYSYSPNSALTTLDTSITITYQNLSINQAITVNSIVLESISIYRAPYKLDFIEGDEFEIYGLILKAHYNNGSSSFIDDYSYSPNRPLNINDNQISFTYNEKSVVQPIVVSVAPTSGYFPIINNQKASINDNPILNLNDLSTRFISETISVNRDSYALSFNMIYVSNLKDKLSRNIKGLPKRFKTNYHQFLFLDGVDENNNPIYKYLDNGAYTHSFYKINDSLYFSYQTNLFLTIDINEDDEEIYTIIDDSQNKLVFNSDGYLVQVIDGFDNSNVKELTYDDNGYLIEVKDNRDMTSKLSFIYQDNQLINVFFIYQNQVVKSLSISYDSEGLLTNIHEMANNSFKELYTFIYNTSNRVKHSSYDRVEYIKDHLNSISYHIACLGFNSFLKEYTTSKIELGYFDDDNHFVKKGALSVGTFNVRLDDLKTINEVRIRDENNIVTSYNIDKLANITATFEYINNEYKTLYKEKGVFVPFDQNIISENGINKYINTHQLINSSLPLSFSLNDDALSLINQYRHFTLRFYLKLNDTSQRIRAFLSGNNISSYPVDINVHQYQRYQLVEIPFSKTDDNCSSLSLTLSFKNENNQNANIDIGNIYVDKADKTILCFNNDDDFVFNDIETISLFPSNSPAYFSFSNSGLIYLTEIDLINTLKRVCSHNDIYQEYLIGDNLGSILFLNNNQSFIRFKFSFVGYSSNNNFTNYHLSNSSLDDSNAWFIESVSFDNKTKTRTYYRFNSGDYEIIKRYYVKNENNDDYILISQTFDKYNYQNKLILTGKVSVSNQEVLSQKIYIYFSNGELKRITQFDGSEFMTLYEASQNNQGYIIQKSNGVNIVNITYNNDAVTSLYCEKHEENQLNIYRKNIGYDSYGDEITDISYFFNQENVATNGLYHDYVSDEILYNLNSGALYKLTNDLANDISYVKRYNGSSFENILSIKKTALLNELTIFKEDFSNEIIKQEFDIYGKLIDEKYNGQTKVTFNYDISGIESLTVLKNLTSINDGYINKTTILNYNGLNYSERIFFDSYFEIKRFYNGFTSYCFDENENYLYEPLFYRLDILSNNIRIQNLSIEHVYDGFNRLINKKRSRNESGISFLEDVFTYQTNSLLCSVFKHKNCTDDLINETYSYDEFGNLYSVSAFINNSNIPNSTPITYSKSFFYDGFNRINYEHNPFYSISNRSYSYDDKGRMEYFGNDQLMYNNQGQLVSFGIITFTYDKYGNRTKKIIGNDEITYSWIRGKLLENINSGEISFTYDYHGIRYSKVTNQEIVTYFYDGNRLIGEDHEGKTNQNTTYPSYKLRFFYDNDGTPLGFKYITDTEEKDYIYIVNPFKEIIGISYYNGSISSLTCSIEAIYIYDAWGNHQVYKSSGLIDNDPYSIGNINPLRYKGYYYDKETNLYYLMSRYYDPSIGQFISPDDYTYLDINKVSGYHLYAYCNNNPVMNEDPDGHMPDWAKWIIGGATIVGIGIATFFTGGAAGVVLGAAFYGAVTGAITGAVVNGLIQGGIAGVNGEDFWENFFHGAADGFMWGAIIGGATSAAVSGLNIATGGVQIIGSSQKTGYLFHRFVSNVNAGKFSMQIGRYSTIALNRSLKSVGMNGGFRPDVLALGSRGSRVIEVVSRAQTIFDQMLKIESMKAINAGLQGIAVDWFLGGWFYL